MAKLQMDPEPCREEALYLAEDLLLAARQNTLCNSDAVLKKMLHYVRLELGMEVAFISEFRNGCRVFRYIDSDSDFCPIEIGGSDPLEESYCQRVVDGRLPELMHNSQENAEATTLAATAALPVGAHISVPLVLSDKSLYGTMCCFSRQSNHELNRRDVENLRFLSYCASLVIERDVEGVRDFNSKRDLINKVIKERSFIPVFQPIFDLQTETVIGFESLTRFTARPQKPPDRWFADAQAVGLQTEMELATLSAAIHCRRELPSNCYMALNLSPNSILNKQQEVIQALTRDCAIVIEITEHDIIDDYRKVNKALRPLRDLGIRVAVDDVGAGFACLKHILLLKPDIIKIDQSIVKSIDRNPDAQAIARAMVAFAQEIACDVVAEGIETAEELAKLKHLGIGRGQGFLLGVPERHAIKKWRAKI